MVFEINGSLHNCLGNFHEIVEGLALLYNPKFQSFSGPFILKSVISCHEHKIIDTKISDNITGIDIK